MYHATSGDLHNLETEALALIRDASRFVAPVLSPPVPVHEIADRVLGVSISSEDLGREYVGVLILDRKRRFYRIAISTGVTNWGRKRFTVSHELGHLIALSNGPLTSLTARGQKKGRRAGLTKKGIRTVLGRPTFCRDEIRRAGDPFELEADWFAASLLMPAYLLVPYLDRFPQLQDADVRTIVSDFQVSQKAAQIRINDLLLMGKEFIRDLGAVHNISVG